MNNSVPDDVCNLLFFKKNHIENTALFSADSLIVPVFGSFLKIMTSVRMIPRWLSTFAQHHNNFDLVGCKSPCLQNNLKTFTNV